MYCASKVAERLDQARLVLGWLPERHSLDEIDRFDHHLLDRWRVFVASHAEYAEVREPPRDFISLLDPWEKNWIRNERFLCSCDADYALTRYLKLMNEEDVIMRFAFRRPQRVLFSVIAMLEEMGYSIELMILKARQLGMTSLVELLMCVYICFRHGVNAVIGSADRTKTPLMAKKLLFAYDNLPWYLREPYSRRVESDQGLIEFKELDSGCTFQHGSQMSGIARGSTPTKIHLSEVASFTNPEQQIEAALFKAVHPSPNVFLVLESSGEGDIGWWPRTWRYSKANWESGGARLCPLFLPWYVDTDLYPNSTWLRRHPVPADWRPCSETQEMMARSHLYVQSMVALRKVLGTSWRMRPEQAYYWEVNFLEARTKKTEKLWLQEMPCTDEEALQRDYKSVFTDVIELVDRSLKPDFQVYGLTGQSIESEHDPAPADIDYGTPDRPVTRELVTYRSPRADSGTSSQGYRWELIPLHYDAEYVALARANPDDPAFRNYIDRKLVVYHPPRPNVDYSIGVDTGGGEGDDGDSTVISVWTIGSKGQRDEQVAEFASNRVSHVESFAFIMPIAAYYSRYMESTTRYREPYVTIEQVKAVGDVAQLQMRKMGYQRFHKMVRYDSKTQNKRTANKMGWFTFGWSRPILLGNFVHCVKNGWAVPHSAWLVEEMKEFEKHSTSTGRERLEHSATYWDDRIFAAAMAVLGPHDLDTMADRTKQRYTAPSLQHLPPLDLSPGGWRVDAHAVTAKSTGLSLLEVLNNVEEYRR